MSKLCLRPYCDSVRKEVHVNREQIIKELKAERDRLNKAIEALEEEPIAVRHAPVRPHLSQSARAEGVALLDRERNKPKREISAESRKKMSEAQKRRWEAAKKKK